MKVSKRDLYLLLALAGVIIAFCSWQFGFKKMTAKTETLRTDTATIQAEIDKYSAIKNNIDIYQKGIEEHTAKIVSVLRNYPVDVLTEDVIMLGRELEKNNVSTYVAGVSVGPKGIVYTATSKPANSSETTVTYQLLNSDVSMSYTTSYKGLQEFFDYINNHENRMSVQNFSVSYDTTTGLLSGSSVVNMYSVTGMDKEYNEQNLSGVQLGTDNIFGTIELQKEE